MNMQFFDSYQFVDQIVKSGMKKEQAEVLANTYFTILTKDIATKQDIKSLDKDIKALRDNMNARFAHMDDKFSHMDEKFSHMDTKFNDLSKKMDIKFDLLGKDIQIKMFISLFLASGFIVTSITLINYLFDL